MIGVNSLDTEKDGRRYISAIEFLFIDTTDLRCQSPSPVLLREILGVFLLFDRDQDGLIQPSEFKDIMDRLGKAQPDIQAPLTLDFFIDYIMSHGITRNGHLDTDKLIDKPIIDNGKDDILIDPVTGDPITPIVPDPDNTGGGSITPAPVEPVIPIVPIDNTKPDVTEPTEKPKVITNTIIEQSDADTLLPDGAQIVLILLACLFGIAIVILVILYLRLSRAKNAPEGIQLASIKSDYNSKPYEDPEQTMVHNGPE